MIRRLGIALVVSLPLFATPPLPAPPPPAAPREVRLPKPVEKTLDNGLRVIVVPKHDIPLVAARLLVKSGAASDPAGRAGVAQLTSAVVTKGTKTRTAEEIARGIEALGATMSASAQWDASSIDVSVMSKHLPRAIELVADVARNATFAKDEFEREQAQTIDVLQVELSEPAAIAEAVASRLIFGGAPYGNRLGGTPASVQSIKRDDLVSFHKRHYRPENAVLVLAGDVKPETAFRMAQSAFGSWKRGAAPAPRAVAKPGEPTRPRVVIIDMPESGQAAVVIGRTGIRRADPAYLPAIVANSVLGGGYSSRLNQEIRIKRGLSYGAGSSFEARAAAGPFTADAQTKHESAPEVAAIIVAELARLSTAGVPESELTPRKAALIGSFAESLESTSGVVNRLSALALYGLPLTEINRYISGVQGVTAEQVRRFAAANLRDAHIVIAGNAKEFEAALRKQFSDVEVISLADLDLASPTLRVRKAKQ